MVFLLYLVDNKYTVNVYDNFKEITNYIEWQDVFEGEILILDKKGIEYEWDSNKKNEIGTVYDYTLIPTERISKLVERCLSKINSESNIEEFTFFLE